MYGRLDFKVTKPKAVVTFSGLAVESKQFFVAMAINHTNVKRVCGPFGESRGKNTVPFIKKDKRVSHQLTLLAHFFPRNERVAAWNTNLSLYFCARVCHYEFLTTTFS